MKYNLTKLSLLFVCALQASIIGAQISGTQTQDLGSMQLPSAAGAATVKDGGLTIHEATGGISTSVSIYTITQSGYTLPVSLSYFSSGFRVDETVPVTGLGWNLVAGGTISKAVRGLKDDDPNGGFQALYGNTTPTPASAANGTHDAEPDLYYFSFCGYSGKFYHDPATLKKQLITEDALKISSDANHNITFVDGNGVKYYFNDKETVTTTEIVSQQAIFTNEISAWFLSRIELPDHSLIEFDYNETTTISKSAPRETDWSKRVYTSGDCFDTYLSYQYFRSQYESSHHTFLPRSITWKTGSLNFVYEMNGSAYKNLAVIECRNNQSELVKKMKLTYQTSSGRLLLASAGQADGADNIINKYEFTYYTSFSVPAQGSASSQDHWGYFNGAAAQEITDHATLGNTLIPTYTPTYYGDNGVYGNTGVSRQPNAATVHALMLKTIKYPEGMLNEISYEPQGSDATHPAPGARVAMIRINDNNGTNTYRKYEYDGMVSLLGMPVYQFPTSGNYLKKNPEVTVNCQAVVRLSEPVFRHNLFYSNPTYYAKIKITTGTDVSDIAGSSLGYTLNTYSTDYYFPDSYGYPAYTESKLGNLLKSEVYNQAGDVVSSTEYVYAFNETASVMGKTVLLQAINYNATTAQNDFVYIFDTYTLRSYRKCLSSIIKKKYATASNSFSTTTVDFTYAGSSLFPTAKKVTTPGGGTYTEHYRRAADYGISGTATYTDASTKALQKMLARNQVAEVIETIGVKDEGTSSELVTAGQVMAYTYDAAADLVVSTGQHYLLTASGLTSTGSFSSVDGSGNFVVPASFEQVSQVASWAANGVPLAVNTKGQSQALLYDAALTSPVCQVSGGAYSDVMYAGFENYEYTHPSGHYVNPKWDVSASCSNPMSSDAFSGALSLNLGNSCSVRLDYSGTISGAACRLTLWSKGGTPVVKDNNSNTLGNSSVIASANGWSLIEYRFSGVSDISITGTGLIDDVLLTPEGAAATFTVYKPLAGAIAACDASGRYTFYDYDAFGRIRTVYDHNRNIIKRYQYGQLQTQQ